MICVPLIDCPRNTLYLLAADIAMNFKRACNKCINHDIASIS